MSTYLVMHQNTTVTLAILHDTSRELCTIPPLLLKADSSSGSLGVKMCGVRSPIGGEIDLKVSLGLLGEGGDICPILGRNLCVSNIVVRHAAIA